MEDQRKTVLDLFAGCGGMSHGFESTGLFRIVAANEFFGAACDTWEANHDGVMVRGDVTSQDTQDALCEACSGKVDVVIGGPPCVAYSMSGRRDPNDPRGKLFEQYIKLVVRLRPEVFVMENVVGIKSMIHDRMSVPQIIVSKFSEQGYSVSHRKLLASDYGVPQDRERIIFVGVREGSGLWPSWPLPTHGKGLRPKKTLRLSVDDLKNLPDDIGFSHIRAKHSKAFLDKIAKTKIGECICKTRKEAFYRARPDLPSPTVMANNGSVFVHYEQNRCMTPRELARLQDFPDHFLFSGSKHDVLVQIGNAVPVGLSKEIGYEVHRMLTGCPSRQKPEVLVEVA